MKEETCVVCGHKLSFLRKYRDLLGEVDLDFYSYEKRVEEVKKELLGEKEVDAQ